jgi:hypothetical protein
MGGFAAFRRRIGKINGLKSLAYVIARVILTGIFFTDYCEFFFKKAGCPVTFLKIMAILPKSHWVKLVHLYENNLAIVGVAEYGVLGGEGHLTLKGGREG